jgi:hypothetical protein
MKHIAFMIALTLGLAVTNAVAADAAAKTKGKLVHVVAFKFKPDASREKVAEVERAFCGLKGKIKEIKTFEWGTNVSQEQKDKGFTHCFVLGFRTEKARDKYIAHDEHQAFVKIVGPVVEDVFVLDYWAKN